jgi:hypothetical protein
MAVFNGMFPVLPGKEDAARAFAKECMGPRLDQFKALQAEAKITRETWAIQETPAGSFVLVWFEGDVEKAFTDLAVNQDEFSVWFRQQVLDNCGVDLGQPPDGPLPELILTFP